MLIRHGPPPPVLGKSIIGNETIFEDTMDAFDLSNVSKSISENTSAKAAWNWDYETDKEVKK